MLDAARVIEVWAPGTPVGMVGSGYLLADGLVLTAGHVVDIADGQHCEVRELGEERWLGAEVAWRGNGNLDAALLRVKGAMRALSQVRAAAQGRIVGNEPVAARAVGFPAAQARPGGVRDTEDLRGYVVPLSAHRSGRLTISITGSVPGVVNEHSLWEGMSGAALFCGDLLVGVVIVAPPHFGADRLEAIPMTTMTEDPAFQAALSSESDQQPAALRVVEAVGLLEEPYWSTLLQPNVAGDDGAASASILLRSDLAVVPFRGRVGYLDELEGWCTTGAPLAVSLLLGGGGTGKSRLAAQLCQYRLSAGAVAGFLASNAAVDCLAGLSGALELLVVVDEAHTRPKQVAELLRVLGDAGGRAPARVLLVARSAGDWWSTQLPALVEDDPSATLALEGARLRELGPVEESDEGRSEAFLAAVDAFAAWQNLGVPAHLIVPDLSGPVFDAILWVHLAALSAVDGETDLLAGPIVRSDLIDYVLRRERRYWMSTARARGLDLEAVVLERAVAVATIGGAGGEDEAANVLLAVPDLAEAPQHVRPLARWLHELYPLGSASATALSTDTAAWLPALTPEPLSEALIARVLKDLQPLPTSMLERATPAQTRVVLTALTQAARNHTAVRAPLQQAISDRLPHMWSVALTVAQGVGDPLGPMLAEALSRTPRPELAYQIASILPEDTVTLRDLAVVATQQLVEHIRGQTPWPAPVFRSTACESGWVDGPSRSRGHGSTCGV